MQQVLRRNREFLALRRVKYVPLNDIRENFTTYATEPARKPLKYLKRRRAHRKVIEFLAEMRTLPPKSDLSPYRQMILSDENMIGSTTPIVRSASLYKRAEKQLSELALHLSGFETDLFFAVRQQGSFASSVFAEAMSQRSGAYLDVRKFRDTWITSRPSWVPVVETMSKAFPASNIYVWDVAKLGEIENEIYSLMAGTDDLLQFSGKVKRPRQSLSQRTIELMLEVQEEQGPAARKDHMREFRLAHPRNDDNPAFSLWTPDELAGFEPDFQQDLAAISKMGDQIHLLSETS